jgi:TPR repeat protein
MEPRSMAEQRKIDTNGARSPIRKLPSIVCLALAFLWAAPHAGRADPIADGFAAYQRGDYLAAYRLCLPLAQQGNGDAEFLMGLMYANGQGVRRNYQEAAQWYQQAADDGQDVAQNNLGLMYAAGLGVRHSYDEAAKLYWLAADQGNPRAQYNLAVAYRDGQGVDQNDVQAYMWYTLSAAAKWDPVISNQSGKERDELAKKMSSAQIAEAQAKVADWKPTTIPTSWPRLVR